VTTQLQLINIVIIIIINLLHYYFVHHKAHKRDVRHWTLSCPPTQN